MIPEEVVLDWAKNKKRIQDRLNRIKKRLKKYQKQEKHFEMRLKAVQRYEKESKQKEASSNETHDSDGVSGGSIQRQVPESGTSSGQGSSSSQT